MSISSFSILCSLLCICAVAEMYDDQWMLENKHTYIFLHGVIDFYYLSQIIGTPVEELLTSNRTIAVEARGWKRRFTGALKENGKWRVTM